MKRAVKTIVVSWADEHKAWRPGYPESVERRYEGHAAIWRNRGDARDLKKAHEYARTEEAKIDLRYEPARIYKAFAYPATEAEPLVRARREIEALAVKRAKRTRMSRSR